MQDSHQLNVLIAQAEGDIASCECGNKTAGTRVRKQMQDIKRACQAVRDKVMSLRGDDADDQV
jgi:hypothetical protein